MTMKEENEITQEVKELLDSLEQHGQNARRQKELSDLIDSLATGTSLREASATKQSTCHKKAFITVQVDCFAPLAMTQSGTFIPPMTQSAESYIIYGGSSVLQQPAFCFGYWQNPPWKKHLI